MSFSYATVPDALATYSETDLRHITDHEGQALDAQRLQLALESASAEIDGWIAARYVVPLIDALGAPLSAAPAVLKRAAIDIAVYQLQSMRPAEDIKDARQRYEDALKMLGRIQTGVMLIPGAALRADASGASPSSSPGGVYFANGSSSSFGRDGR